MANPHRVPLRTFLWEYLGYPEGETAERRRILYAIVVLRLGFGLFFLLRGWGAIFGSPAAALVARLGDPARLGLSGASADTALFILGCTELGAGALLLFGAFTRVSAATGALLLLLALLVGDRSALDPRPGAVVGGASTLVATLSVVYLAGLAVLLIAGSPFLSADRALDKLEEEERDRAPAILPSLAERSALILRLGVAVACLWLAIAYPPVWPAGGTVGMNAAALLWLIAAALALMFPIVAPAVAVALLVWAFGNTDDATRLLALPLPFVALAFVLTASSRYRPPHRRADPLRA